MNTISIIIFISVITAISCANEHNLHSLNDFLCVQVCLDISQKSSCSWQSTYSLQQL